LQQPGQLVTREQVQRHLWPDGIVVEFEHSVNAAETIPRRGYRFIARVENGHLAASAVVGDHIASVPVSPTLELRNKRRFVVIAVVAASLMVAAVATWRVFFARPVLTDADVILVASFVNKTGDPIFDNSLDKALEVKLTESPFLSLLPDAGVRCATIQTSG
jgi:hypothetical protein